MGQEDFWLVAPQDLLKTLSLLPHKGDSLDQMLNALTRLLIVLVVILALLKWKHWEMLLILGLALIIYIYLTKRQDCLIEGFNEDPNSDSFKYYQQAPLESLYRYYCATGVPIDEQGRVISSEVTPAPLPVQPVEEPIVVPPAPQPVIEPTPAPAPQPKKKRVPKTAADEERASWDVLRKQKAKLDETGRKSLMRSIF